MILNLVVIGVAVALPDHGILADRGRPLPDRDLSPPRRAGRVN
jgi:hypothetical protein